MFILLKLIFSPTQFDAFVDKSLINRYTLFHI